MLLAYIEMVYSTGVLPTNYKHLPRVDNSGPVCGVFVSSEAHPQSDWGSFVGPGPADAVDVSSPDLIHRRTVRGERQRWVAT
jgi:hypothetical protein